MSSPLISEPAVTAAATILGTIVGALATYASQRAQWNRQYESRWDEAKKNSYAALFTICNQWWRAIHWNFNNVDDIRNRYMEVTGEVSILADEQTRQAAVALADYLGDLTAKFNESPARQDRAGEAASPGEGTKGERVTDEGAGHFLDMILAADRTGDAASSNAWNAAYLTDYFRDLASKTSPPRGSWPPGYDIAAELANFVACRNAYRDAVRRELFGKRHR